MTVTMLEPINKQYLGNQERTCCSVGLFGMKLSLLTTKRSGRREKREARQARKVCVQEKKLAGSGMRTEMNETEESNYSLNIVKYCTDICLPLALTVATDP